MGVIVSVVSIPYMSGHNEEKMGILKNSDMLNSLYFGLLKLFFNRLSIIISKIYNKCYNNFKKFYRKDTLQSNPSKKLARKG